MHTPNIHSTGEVDEAQYPGGRYYAEMLELKKLTAYASDATVSYTTQHQPHYIIALAYTLLTIFTGTFHEPFQVFEHGLLRK